MHVCKLDGPQQQPLTLHLHQDMGAGLKLSKGNGFVSHQALLMEHFIPWDCSGTPELEAVCHRPSVKPVVEGAVIAPEVVIFMGVQQLIDGEVAGNAEGLPAH